VFIYIISGCHGSSLLMWTLLIGGWHRVYVGSVALKVKMERSPIRLQNKSHLYGAITEKAGSISEMFICYSRHTKRFLAVIRLICIFQNFA
jgi:hypothetical protein